MIIGKYAKGGGVGEWRMGEWENGEWESGSVGVGVWERVD